MRNGQNANKAKIVYGRIVGKLVQIINGIGTEKVIIILFIHYDQQDRFAVKRPASLPLYSLYVTLQSTLCSHFQGFNRNNIKYGPVGNQKQLLAVRRNVSVICVPESRYCFDVFQIFFQYDNRLSG